MLESTFTRRPNTAIRNGGDQRFQQRTIPLGNQVLQTEVFTPLDTSYAT